MERPNKGRSVNTYINDYCVLDLETTGVFVTSSRIIEIAAIKVREGEVVDEFSSLINPETSIPETATAVNNITDDMVKDAPILDDVIDSILEFIGDDVIVGYNNAGFDINMIYDATTSLRGIPFSNNYLDVLHSARRCITDIENHKLETICNYYLLDTEGEHRALKDCYLTKCCYEKLYNDYGDSIFSKSNSKKKKEWDRLIVYSAESRALQQLQDLLEEIVADDKTIHLNSEIDYSGKEKPSEEEKLVRKAIGLPLTKSLVYYKNKHDQNSAVVSIVRGCGNNTNEDIGSITVFTESNNIGIESVYTYNVELEQYEL